MHRSALKEAAARHVSEGAPYKPPSEAEEMIEKFKKLSKVPPKELAKRLAKLPKPSATSAPSSALTIMLIHLGA